MNKRLYCLNIYKNKINKIVRCNHNDSVRSTASSGSKVYESKRAVYEYLLTHYGSTDDIMPYEFKQKDALNFTEHLSDLCTKYTNDKNRALDLGCSVGGSSFHLTKSFKEVFGIDFSQHFIDAANTMKSNKQMDYEILKQGQIYIKRVAKVPTNIDASKVSFEVGDACNLRTSLGKFDMILCSNLLCRLPSPRKFLNSVKDFLTPKGTLILISPYSWLEEYTPASEWIGAKDNIDRYNYHNVVITLL